MHWNDTSKLAWGILLLFGGGLALAKGMATSGLVAMITESIQNGGFSPLIVVSLLIVLMLFMTALGFNQNARQGVHVERGEIYIFYEEPLRLNRA